MIKNQNLVSHWRFEGNANDYVGNNNGTVTGATIVNGKFGKAYSFNSTNGDYITPTNAFLATSIIRNTGITISCWFYTSSFNVDMTILSQTASIGYSIGSDGFLCIQGNKLQWAMHDGTTYRYCNGTTTLKTDTWYYLTATYNPSTKDMKCYVNGVIDGTLNTPNLFGVNNPALRAIGKNLKTGVPYYMNGIIDELKIYNIPLIESQIRKDMLNFAPFEF